MTIQTNAIETPPTYTRGKVEGSENRGWISMKLKVLKSANVDMTLVEGHLKLSLRIVHPRTKSLNLVDFQMSQRFLCLADH